MHNEESSYNNDLADSNENTILSSEEIATSNPIVMIIMQN